MIQPVEEGSFDKAGCIFFAGSREFTIANVGTALHTGAKIIDLSGALAEREGTVAWFPKLDWLRGREFDTQAKVFAVPSAIATAACGAGAGIVSRGAATDHGDGIRAGFGSGASGN